MYLHLRYIFSFLNKKTFIFQTLQQKVFLTYFAFLNMLFFLKYRTKEIIYLPLYSIEHLELATNISVSYVLFIVQWFHRITTSWYKWCMKWKWSISSAWKIEMLFCNLPLDWTLCYIKGSFSLSNCLDAVVDRILLETWENLMLGSW